MKSKYVFVKSFLDVLIAYLLLVICYFPMLLIAISIKVSDGGPVIFKQKRVGINGKIFVCYKFRTMRCDAPSEMPTKDFINAKEYYTRIGAFLRKTSLDELPQLFNVLAGEMSLVGPRPLIVGEKEIHKWRSRFGVYNARPGITGLSQICGRDNLDDIRKIECDTVYVSNINFISDVNIIVATMIGVIKKEGIGREGNVLLDISRQ